MHELAGLWMKCLWTCCCLLLGYKHVAWHAWTIITFLQFYQLLRLSGLHNIWTQSGNCLPFEWSASPSDTYALDVEAWAEELECPSSELLVYQMRSRKSLQLMLQNILLNFEKVWCIKFVLFNSTFALNTSHGSQLMVSMYLSFRHKNDWEGEMWRNIQDP